MTEIFPILYADPPFTVRYDVPRPESLTDIAALHARIEELESKYMWCAGAMDVLMQVCTAEEIQAVLTESQRAAVKRVKRGTNVDHATAPHAAADTDSASGNR